MTTNNGTLSAAGSRKPEKATITNVETSESFEVLFNPTEYSMSKTNNWKKITIRESNVALPEFLGGNPRELRIQLFFDTYEKHEDVRVYTKKIIKLTDIGKYDGRRRPPRCLFSWGPGAYRTHASSAGPIGQDVPVQRSTGMCESGQVIEARFSVTNVSWRLQVL